MQALSDALHVSYGAVLGVAARVCLGRALGPSGARVASPTSALFADLPANAAGSLLAGAFAPARPRVARLHGGLPHAVATGFLGSLTTFASWNLQVTRMLVAGDVAAGLFALVLGVLVPFAAFAVGGDVYDFGAAALRKLRHARASGSADAREDARKLEGEQGEDGGDGSGKAPRCETWACFAAAAVLVVGLLGAAATAYALDSEGASASAWRRKLWLSCVLAPSGALARWQLARFGLRGTFAANTLAALLDAGLAAALSRASAGSWAQTVLPAVITGAGGTLSTVSTWAGEVAKLRAGGERRVAYAYVVGAVVAAQGVGLLVYGSVVWAS